MSKQQQLLDAALHLFASQGVQATTTASIAQQAKVANGTLFHHFPTKQVLVDTLYLHAKQSLAAAMTEAQPSPSLQTRLWQFWQSALDWAARHPAQLQLMQQLSHDPHTPISHHQDLIETTMGFLSHAIEQGQQQGKLAPLPMPLVLHFCHHHYLATAKLFAEYPERAQQPSYRQGAFQILWQGLQPTPQMIEMAD
ncbi:TetR/AcrR family transcriptional regulator [Photobacterium nomapromontoriensis]|uniref:TetR/AcrR family transcriptional regulator n=1 Tax=Photobacterium nomapromontoriensis TaxID=2910237 RepID=UPI003D147096